VFGARLSAENREKKESKHSLRLSAASLHKPMRKDESVGPMPIYERPRIRTRENECSQQDLFSASCFFALIYVNCWNSASAHAIIGAAGGMDEIYLMLENYIKKFIKNSSYHLLLIYKVLDLINTTYIRHNKKDKLVSKY
jgi:hypothetical protein